MEKYLKNGSVLYILNILRKYSDEEHLLSSNDISRLIDNEYKVKLDSRKIRRDINLLIETFGYDIETYQDNKIGYMLRRDPEKDFELGELQVIINAFSYSNFIPSNISATIVSKCLNKMNIYEQAKYKNHKISLKNTKTNNQEIIKNIEDINDAISKKKKITFDYYKYSILNNKLVEERVIPKKPYIVSPYKITYNLQKLYLFCKKDGINKIIKYRLDRMKNIKITNKRIDNKYTEKEIDYEIKNNLSMYTGDSIPFEIECDMSMLDTIVETFGKDIKVELIDENTFKTKVFSPEEGFKYFCLRNIETVKILSPNNFKRKIIKIIKENM